MPRVIYASTKDADMHYAVGMHIPDPFFFIDLGERKYAFLDVRELTVFEEKKKDSGIDAVPLEPLLKHAQEKKEEGTSTQKLALHLFETYGFLKSGAEVPADFPLDIADFLRAHGATLLPRRPFYPERARKKPYEVEAIRSALQRTCSAFRRIESILKASEIDRDTLVYKGEALTSERMKREAEQALLDEGLMSVEGMIISCGAQASIPHHPGAGAIYPHVPIICDIFPRDRETGYFADMTRTYVKGTPAPETEKMYEAVIKAQGAAFSLLGPGRSGAEVHESACKVLGRGFVHSLGHGVGLEIHEAPSLGSSKETVLEAGNVVTVEPGLYYPEAGGIRVEDVVCITEDGYENLTAYPKELVIE